MNSGAPEGSAVPVPLVAPVVLLLNVPATYTAAVFVKLNQHVHKLHL